MDNAVSTMPTMNRLTIVLICSNTNFYRLYNTDLKGSTMDDDVCIRREMLNPSSYQNFWTWPPQ